jgi:hypothetical protein
LEKKVASRIVQPVDTKAFPVIEDKERVDFLSLSEGKDHRTVAPGAGVLGETGTGPKENLPPELRRRRVHILDGGLDLTDRAWKILALQENQ